MLKKQLINTQRLQCRMIIYYTTNTHNLLCQHIMLKLKTGACAYNIINILHTHTLIYRTVK